MKRLALILILSLGALRPALAATVLVTGANSGIGLEFAATYAARGWDVIATHRRDETPESFPDMSRRIIEKEAEIPLVLHRAVQGIVSIQ